MSKSGRVVQTLEEACFRLILFKRDSNWRGAFKNAAKLMPQLERISEGKPLWFMQDGVPPHYATIVRNWLSGNFENWIRQRHRRMGTKVPC